MEATTQTLKDPTPFKQKQEIKKMGTIKKVIYWSIAIAVPCGILIIIAKYFFFKKNGGNPTPEEAVAEGVNFVKRVFSILAK